MSGELSTEIGVVTQVPGVTRSDRDAALINLCNDMIADYEKSLSSTNAFYDLIYLEPELRVQELKSLDRVNSGLICIVSSSATTLPGCEAKQRVLEKLEGEWLDHASILSLKVSVLKDFQHIGRNRTNARVGGFSYLDWWPSLQAFFISSHRQSYRNRQ